MEQRHVRKVMVGVGAVAVLTLSACGGGGPKQATPPATTASPATTSSSAATSQSQSTSSVATFCTNFGHADYIITNTDFNSKSFQPVLTDLGTALAVAPSAVKSDVQSMLDASRKLKFPNNADSATLITSGVDLTPITNPMGTIQSWADNNCPSGWLTGP